MEKLEASQASDNDIMKAKIAASLELKMAKLASKERMLREEREATERQHVRTMNAENDRQTRAEDFQKAMQDRREASQAQMYARHAALSSGDFHGMSPSPASHTSHIPLPHFNGSAGVYGWVDKLPDAAAFSPLTDIGEYTSSASSSHLSPPF